MDLRRYLHWIVWMRVVFRLSYRKGIGIWKGMIFNASHVVAYPVFTFKDKIALGIVCYVCIFTFIVES